MPLTKLDANSFQGDCSDRTKVAKDKTARASTSKVKVTRLCDVSSDICRSFPPPPKARFKVTSTLARVRSGVQKGKYHIAIRILGENAHRFLPVGSTWLVRTLQIWENRAAECQKDNAAHISPRLLVSPGSI